MYKTIEEAFNRKNWKGEFHTLGKQWTRFKVAWQAEGYTPVAEPRYEAYDGKPGYVFIGVRTNADEAISKRENRSKKQKEKHQAEQARRGMEMRYDWNHLSNEEVQNLISDGITESMFNSMSLDEQEQWLECHG